MAIEKDILDQLLAGREPKDLLAKDGLVDELKKARSERILNTELDEHFGEEAAAAFLEVADCQADQLRRHFLGRERPTHLD